MRRSVGNCDVLQGIESCTEPGPGADAVTRAAQAQR